MSQVQTIQHLSKILKDAYLPAFRNQITTDPSPFLEKVRKVPLVNQKIVASAPLGLNGGFAFGADGGLSAPDAGAQRYAGFELPAKNMYVNIEITDKVVKLAGGNGSAMLNAFDQEVKGAYAAANFNIGRALFGDGVGNLCYLEGSTGTTITVDDTAKLREGLLVDIISPAGAVAVASARILSINRAEKTVTLDKTNTYAAGQFLTVQKSYDNEICGIGAIMNDDIDTLYGVEKAGNEWIKPIVKDAQSDVGDIILYEGVSEAMDYKNSKIDMLLCGNEAFQSYQRYMRSHNTVMVGDQLKFKGGAVGYVLNVGSREVVLVNERFVPSTEIWGVETGAWQFHHTELDFATVDDSSAFTLVPGTTYYRALLAMYGNLICENPGGCVRFVNCGDGK